MALGAPIGAKLKTDVGTYPNAGHIALPLNIGLVQINNSFSGQNYFPDGMERPKYYEPTERGYEAEIKERLDRFAKLRKQRSGG